MGAAASGSAQRGVRRNAQKPRQRWRRSGCRAITSVMVATLQVLMLSAASWWPDSALARVQRGRPAAFAAPPARVLRGARFPPAFSVRADSCTCQRSMLAGKASDALAMEEGLCSLSARRAVPAQRSGAKTLILGMQPRHSEDRSARNIAEGLDSSLHSERIAGPEFFVPWVARSESRRITANLKEMLRSEPARARAYFHALCLEGKADSFHFSVMMNASPDITSATELLDQMRQQGIVPQTASFNVLLKKLCLEGNMDAAEELLLEMQEAGVPPDERSFTQLVCAYSNLGSTELARRVFQRMQAAGFACRLSSWEDLVARVQIKVNTAKLAGMLSKGPDHRLQAERFYQGLVASNATDVVLFNIMLNASRSVEDARAVWHEMVSVVQLAPTSTSFNTFLRVLCENGRTNEAMQLLREAESADIADMRTYTRIISHLHERGEVDSARQVYARCEQQLSHAKDSDTPSGWMGTGEPEEDATGGQVCGSEQGSEEPYMSLLRKVASSEKTKALHRLLQAGRSEDAWQLFRSWADKGDADTYAYNTIMHGLGSASRALSLKQDMSANAVPQSVATWNILVQLLSMEGRVAEAQEILDEMEDQGITPSDRTLKPLLKAMRLAGFGREARRLKQRCKLQRRVKEKEAQVTGREATTNASQRQLLAEVKDDLMTETDRKDAATAAIAAQIVQRQLAQQNPSTLSPLPSPPPGSGRFQSATKRVGSGRQGDGGGRGGNAAAKWGVEGGEERRI